MEVFQDYAYYYNAFYKEKKYKEEAKQIELLLSQFGNGGNRLIDYGCGTGKHDIELCKSGKYQCEGIDMSTQMISIAKQNAKSENCQIEFSVADIRKYVPVKRYDAVISLFHVMSYQASNMDVLNAFTSARNALDAGGIFLFDVWYGPGVLSDKPVVRVKEVEDEKYRLVRIAKPLMNDKYNTVDVCYEVLVIDKESNVTKVINEKHVMRYFFRPELELLLERTGFKLIRNLDCQNLKETDFNSWTSYFIAQAI